MKAEAKKISIYFIIGALPKIIPMLMLPLLSRALSLQEMGEYALYLSYAGIFSFFYTFSFESGFTKFLVERREGLLENQEPKAIVSWLIFFLCLIPLVSLGLWIFVPLDIIFFVVACAAYNTYSSILERFFRVEERLGNYVIWIFFRIACLGLTILGWFLFDPDRGLSGLLFGLSLIYLTLFIVSSVLLFHNIGWTIDKKSLFSILIYSRPLVLNRLFQLGWAPFFTWVIAVFYDAESLALYYMALTIANSLTVFTQAALAVFSPRIYQVLIANKLEQARGNINLLFIAVILIAFGIFICHPVFEFILSIDALDFGNFLALMLLLGVVNFVKNIDVIGFMVCLSSVKNVPYFTYISVCSTLLFLGIFSTESPLVVAASQVFGRSISILVLNLSYFEPKKPSGFWSRGIASVGVGISCLMI